MITLNKLNAGFNYLLNKENLNNIDSIILDEHFSLQRKLVNHMINNYLYANDSVINYDSIALGLRQIEYGWSYKILLARILATQHKFIDAKNVLKNIPSQYIITSSEASDINNLIKMYDILEFLWLNNDNWDLVPNDMKNDIQNTLTYQKGIYSYPLANYFVMRYKFSDFTSNKGNKKTENNSVCNNSRLISIYPNPTTDIIELKWEKQGNISAQLNLYDLQGSLVFIKELNKIHQKINISHLNTGVYIVQIIENQKEILNQKIIKK